MLTLRRVYISTIILGMFLWTHPAVAQETVSQNPSSATQNNSQKTPGGGSGEAAIPRGSQPNQTKTSKRVTKQSKRILWVVPNFGAVSADTQLPPLSTHEKFTLAMEDSVDYSSFTWAGILAAQGFFLNADPELGHGIAGYGRYYWRTFVDGASGSFLSEAIVPAITHEDPRYYTSGHGNFFARTGYALSRTVLTKTDSGGTSFNWSEVAGGGLEATLSNAYYPPQERGLSQTARNWGTQMESAALNNIVKEFWPDIRHKILRQK